MKGDFSRWTFDPTKHYSRVLSLQGRVFLDADFNEAQELQLHHLRTLTTDLLGPHAGPGTGFAIVAATPASATDFLISQGSYYVNGILCENPSPPPPPSRSACCRGRQILGSTVLVETWTRSPRAPSSFTSTCLGTLFL